MGIIIRVVSAAAAIFLLLLVWATEDSEDPEE